MSDVRTCYLGCPAHGGLTAGTARAVFGGASPEGRLRVRVACQGHSLLGHNFNELWVWALNAAEAGERVDLFAMLHADVAPEPGWLDVLVGELDQGYDLVSAVVPIKDHRGLTSTAAGHATDRFDVDFRLTMQEVLRLPETFTANDVCPGRPLLVNTGCWVCRFDPAWAARCHFEIESRIARQDGRWRAVVNPEDWNFSRQVHALGLRVAATRKVSLIHHGDMAYGNQSGWGEYEYDQDRLAASRVAAPAAEEVMSNG